MSNSLGLNVQDPSNNDFTLGKIDLETRESFKAEEKELQVSYTIIVQFNHYDGIVRILEVGDSIRGKVGADMDNMTTCHNPSQNVGEGVSYKVEEKALLEKGL